MLAAPGAQIRLLASRALPVRGELSPAWLTGGAGRAKLAAFAAKEF